jgi:hypothetical protein
MDLVGQGAKDFVWGSDESDALNKVALDKCDPWRNTSRYQEIMSDDLLKQIGHQSKRPISVRRPASRYAFVKT